MTLRTLRCITLTILSHLLLVPLAFTSQLPSLFDTQAAAPAPSQEVTIKAREQSKQGDMYTLDGDVEVDFQGYTLRAEHAEYNEATGGVEATGRVVFEGGPHEAHITAARAAYNVKTDSGTFYEVAGTFGAVVRGQTVVLTTSNPFVVAAKEVQKLGRNRYVVSHGSITSCAGQGGPQWTFESEKIDLVAGEDAKLYHSSFRLMKFPLFYVPYTNLPASQNSRNSGFLLPSIGNSTTKGFIFGDSVYWAINRSNDVAVGAEYFSARGWSENVHFRSKPNENSTIELRYFGVQDRGAPGTHQDQGGDEVRLVADTTRDSWRGSASIDYLSSFLFRQAFSTTYTQAVNSEVESTAFLSHNRNGFSLNIFADRYQNFFFQQPITSTVSDQVKILRMPVGEFNALEHPIGDAPLRWAMDSSIGGFGRSEPGFSTAPVVGRFNVRPRIAAPLQWHGWDLRPEVAIQDTEYSQQIMPSPDPLLNPLGTPSDAELSRRAVEASIELLPPVLEKIYERPIFGRRLKHVIQPILTYNYVNGVNNFQNIIRFDQTDILSNTSEFEYDVIQRIYGRRNSQRRQPGCEATNAPTPFGEDKIPPAYIPGISAPRLHCEAETDTAHELLSWEVKQKYFYDKSFGGALVPGIRNVLATTEDLTGIAFLDSPRAWSPIISTVRVQTTANTDVQWQLDYDSIRGRINSSATFLEYRRGEYFAGMSHAFFNEIAPANATSPGSSNPPIVFDQIRYLVGYGHPNKRGLAGGFSMGYDKNLDFLQYAAGQSSYNWDCCGVSFEIRHMNVPGVNEETQYRFAFTLANIGTFGNLRRQERLY